MPVDQNLLQILACPQCKGKLDYKTSPETLTCPKCRLVYEVKEGIPVMLVDEAKKI
jgi:uncharacterized protein YbaR (Trm112 family)